MTALAAAKPASRRQPRRARLLAPGLAVLVALLAGVAFLALAVGARSVGLDVVLDALFAHDAANSDHQVIANRQSRLLAGLLVGAALGLAGALMQGITRNPLADPGLLGINAGAAFAVVCAISGFGIVSIMGYVWFAFGGALVVAVLVYAVGSLGRGGATPVKLALAGAAVGAAFMSLTTAVLLTDSLTFDQHRFWTVGSLTGRSPEIVGALAPFIGIGVLVALFLGRVLNALSLGDEMASGLGQRVGAARAVCGVTAVVLCGAATALAGPIWFVGLFVPHLARLLTGPDYRWTLPYSLVVGPILVVASDVLGRVIARPGEVQVGVVLAFVGAPLLIGLIRFRRVSEL